MSRVRLLGLLCSSLLLAVALVYAKAGSQESNSQEKGSAEMKAIYAEDQADRESNMAGMTPEQRLAWINQIGPRDARRRQQVLDLIARNALQTGEDFDQAAFVFQHGEQPDDFLLAHTLATVAISKGSAKSRWIAAATLDRYLQRIRQPQIYGTQYQVGPGAEDKFTQEPYNRKLIPDALRNAMCVPDQAAQQATLEMLLQGKEPAGQKKIPGC